MNKATIVGRLGGDPELRHTKSGNPVANMSVATSYYHDGEEKTEWHRVVAWGKQATSCAQYLSKGSQVAVDGRIQTSEWEDDNGNTRKSTEIVANRVEFLGSSEGGGSSSGSVTGPSGGGEEHSDSSDYDDVPF